MLKDNECNSCFIRKIETFQRTLLTVMSSILLLFMTTLTTIRSCWEQQGHCMKWTLLALTFAQISDAQECSQTFNTRQGVITTPFYPENYKDDMDCVYTIQQTLGFRIILSFLDFELEEDETCDYDFVEIRDGENSSSPILGKRLCNVTLPLDLKSSKSRLWIRFKTDNSRAFRGFKASYTTECGGNFTGRFRHIQLYLNTSDSNLDCIYFISQPTGYHIHLSSFEFLSKKESCTHSVQIFGGGSLTSPLLANASCNMRDSLSLRTTENIMMIRFQTNGTTDHDGFNARYSAECGGIFTERKGVIKSHNYPDIHESDIDCVYIISQPSGHVIHLYISDLKLYILSSPNVLKLYDGGSQSSPLISSLTNEKPPLVFTSTQSAMLIVFQTNGFRTRTTFHATYTSECGGIFNIPQGMISSPFYPDNYGNNLDCVYVIRSRAGYQIKFMFVDIGLEVQSSCTDFVEVRDEMLDLCWSPVNYSSTTK